MSRNRPGLLLVGRNCIVITLLFVSTVFIQVCYQTALNLQRIDPHNDPFHEEFPILCIWLH